MQSIATRPLLSQQSPLRKLPGNAEISVFPQCGRSASAWPPADPPASTWLQAAPWASGLRPQQQREALPRT